METLDAFEGISFDMLCDRVIPRVESKATNKRKLIHSTLLYLQSGENPTVEKIGGLYYLIDRRRA